MAGYSTIGEYKTDNLIAGSSVPIVTKKYTVKAGAGVLPRGGVIGVETVTRKAVLVDSALGNGAQHPQAILSCQVDATAEDVEVIAYQSGEFNTNALTFGGNDTSETHEAALRALNVHLKRNVEY